MILRSDTKGLACQPVTGKWDRKLFQPLIPIPESLAPVLVAYEARLPVCSHVSPEVRVNFRVYGQAAYLAILGVCKIPNAPCPLG